MKLKEYIKKLTELLGENPEAGEYTVITSIDDEGNGFNEVHFDPSVGIYEDGEFSQELEEDERDANSVCVN